MTTALYRRYRPESFAEVIGQEHVTGPLMQALRSGRINHAYLFSGPRGCGKTTSARILARCLNCEQGPTPTPCGVCDSCVALARGGPGSVDVIEIDAASHGGVDDARDLRERASYGPASSRYKVYIIDEAHMVTPQGFNALLKIVEEPPEHVKFVFATTEPEKVIGTIRSRTHHYPFRLVPPAALTTYMQHLCDEEGVSVAPGVLGFVVRAGGGSVRDSLSVLDQLIAGSTDERLTYEMAASLLGFTDGELIDATIDSFAAGDGAAVFAQVDKVVESGHDPRRFVEDLLERLRDLIVVAAVPDGAGAVLRGVPDDQLDRMRGQAARFGSGGLSRAADIVNTGLTEMTGATAPRLQLELICARILLPAASGEQGYGARLDRIERRLEVGGVAGATAGGPAVAATSYVHGEAQRPQQGAAQHGAPREGAPREGAPREGAPREGASQRPEEAARQRPQESATGDRTAPTRGHPGDRPSEQGPGAERGEGGHGRRETHDSRGATSASAASSSTGPLPGAVEPTAASSPRETSLHVEEGTRFPAPGPASAARGLDVAAIRRVWPDVLARIFSMRRATWTFVSQHAQVQEYDGRRLVLGIATVGLANTFRQGNHAELVRQALIDEIGLDVVVEGVPATDVPPPKEFPLPADDGGPVTRGDGGSGSRGDGGRESSEVGPSPAPPGGSQPRPFDRSPGGEAPAGPSAVAMSSAGTSLGATSPTTSAAGTPAAVSPASSPVTSTAARSPVATSSGSARPDWGGAPSSPGPDWASAPGTAQPTGASAPGSAPTPVATPYDAAAVTVVPSAPVPASAPSPARRPTPPPVTAAPEVSGPVGLTSGEASFQAAGVREELARVRREAAERGPGAPRGVGEGATQVATRDEDASRDDEDFAESGRVGREVIERVLGGHFLGDFED